MISIVIALCLTSMVASAPSDVRPIVDKVEARNIDAIVKPANGAWGYFNSHPVDAKGFPGQQGQQGQFQQFPMSVTPGSRYFPGHLPFYYPSYPQLNSDFGGIYETKSDSSTPDEDEEALRIFFGLFGGGSNTAAVGAAAATTTTTTTTTTPAPATTTTATPVVAAGATAARPMANLMNKLVVMNNMAIVKLLLANAAMMVVG